MARARAAKEALGERVFVLRHHYQRGVGPHRPQDGLPEQQFRDARMILWRGHCSVHGRFTPESVVAVRERVPDVTVLVHPECTHEVLTTAASRWTPRPSAGPGSPCSGCSTSPPAPRPWADGRAQRPGAPHTGIHRLVSPSTGRSWRTWSRTWSSSTESRCCAAPGRGENG